MATAFVTNGSNSRPPSNQVVPLEAGTTGPLEDSVGALPSEVGGDKPIHGAAYSGGLQKMSAGSFGARTSSSKARRASMPVFDPSRAMENASDCFGSQYYVRWKAHRSACFSEMNFKVGAALWALMLESLPSAVSSVIVTCVSGRQEAKNRMFVFPFILMDYIFFSGVFYLLFALWWWAKDELDDGAIYEVVGVGLFLFGRAMTLAVKYATYPSETLKKTSELGVHDVDYEKKSIRDKAQMATYIMNLTGFQKMQLVHILYKSCLFGDVDLSAAFFHAPVDPTSVHGEAQTTALEIWEHCLQSISEVYNSDDIGGSEQPAGGEPLPRAPSTLERRFSLHVNPSAGQAASDLELQDVGSDAQARTSMKVRHEEKEDLHRRTSSIGAVHGRADLGRSAEYLEDGVLLATYFRSTNRDITALAKRGQIPASVIALNLIFKFFYRQQSKGAKVMILLNVAALFIGVGLQPFLRSVVGKAPFGEGPREQAFRAFLSWAQFPGLSLLLYFNVAPILWYWSKLKLTREMLAMIVGREDSYVCGGNLRIMWSTEDLVEDHPLLRINTRCPEDVAAWASLRTVLHGGSFGPVIHRKFQLYGLIMFTIFLALPTIQALGSFYAEADSGQDTINIDAKVLSIARLFVLGVPLMIQVFVCFWVNQYTNFQEEAIFRAQRSNLAVAAALRARGGAANEEEADQLERAAGVLSSVAEEIRASEQTSPMRVLGMVAQPSVVFTIVSIMTSILVLEVRELGIVPFLE